MSSCTSTPPIADLDDDDAALDLESFAEDAVVALADPVGVLAASEFLGADRWRSPASAPPERVCSRSPMERAWTNEAKPLRRGSIIEAPRKELVRCAAASSCFSFC